MSDRRDGMERREDEQGVTLGELYRVCERIEKRMTELGDGIERDVHSLRNRIQKIEVESALQAKDLVAVCAELAAVKEQLADREKEWRGRFWAGVTGGGLALLPQIPAFLKWLSQ